MTGFWPGLVVFLIALASGTAGDALLKLPISAGRLASGLGLAASVCCVGLGIVHALFDWGFVDLLGMADAQGISTLSKRGFALGLIELWPFAMIVIGIFGVVLYGVSFRRLFAR